MTHSAGMSRIRTALLVAMVAISLTGCDPYYEYRCVNGVLYFRDRPHDPFYMVDATPNQKAVTPTPCVVEKP